MPGLSFLRLSQGYSLMVNQGEGRARVAQLVQAAFDDGAGSGLRGLYPEEAGGGALLGVNERGAAFVLLSQAVDARLERLVPAALASATAGGGLERAAALGLEGLPAFVLAGVEPAQAPLSLAWDGQALERRLHPDGAFQLSLGSEAEVVRARQGFEALGERLEGLDPAQVLAAQEDYQRALPWARQSQLLLLPRRILLRFLDAPAHAAGREPQAAWLVRSDASAESP